MPFFLCAPLFVKDLPLSRSMCVSGEYPSNLGGIFMMQLVASTIEVFIWWFMSFLLGQLEQSVLRLVVSSLRPNSWGFYYFLAVLTLDRFRELSRAHLPQNTVIIWGCLWLNTEWFFWLEVAFTVSDSSTHLLVKFRPCCLGKRGLLLYKPWYCAALKFSTCDTPLKSIGWTFGALLL